MTEWRPIPGADGYEASSDGQVRGPRGILKPSKLTSGYYGVKLRGQGTTVHAAVARAFIGPRPSNKHTVNHKNGDKLDNRPSNLEWLTQAENNRHAVEVLGRSFGRPRKATPVIDARPVISLDLSGVGGRSLVLEPRLGFIAYRARDAATGEVLECAALKELLHRIADRLPRTMAPRECT